jgi:hypothetical protein
MPTMSAMTMAVAVTPEIRPNGLRFNAISPMHPQPGQPLCRHGGTKPNTQFHGHLGRFFGDCRQRSRIVPAR